MKLYYVESEFLYRSDTIDGSINFYLKLRINGKENIVSYMYNKFNNILYKIVYYSSIIHTNYIVHKEDGPAYIEYYDNGGLVKVCYYINSQLHRINGPSVEIYRIDGSLMLLSYFYKNEDCTLKVMNWMKANNYNSYEEMTEDDFNRMWMEIL